MDTLIHGSGPVRIIAIHGIQGTNRVWLPLACELQESCTFILPNLPGRGKHRACTREDMTLSAFANVIEATVHKYINEGQSYCLAGWSMGVSVALQFIANTRLARPEKVMLLSGVPDVGQTSWFSQHTDDALLDEIAQRETRLKLQTAAEHHAVMWTWQSIAQASLREQCHALTMPCLVITGEKDTDSPLSLVSEFRNLLPNPTFRTIADAGHSILTENTAAVGAEFTHFFNLEYA